LQAALDPVASGFVDSLARPGGNVTGLSLQSSDIAPKRIEILREAIPGLGRLAIMANAGYPGAARESAAIQKTARELGLTVSALDIRNAEAFHPTATELLHYIRARRRCYLASMVAAVAIKRAPIDDLRASSQSNRFRPTTTTSVLFHKQAAKTSTLRFLPIPFRPRRFSRRRAAYIP
jgi:hypothetical protein